MSEEKMPAPKMLTTMDNPYNPFKDWDNWYSFDQSHGYRTCELLDRFTHVHESMTELEEANEIADARKRICNLLFMIFKEIGPDEDPDPKPIKLEES